MSRVAYRFHPEAEDEFLAAVDWYADRDADVAADFAALVRESVDRITQRPRAAPAWPGSQALRVRVLRRFRFSVVYALQADLIVIMAVAHHRRRSGYWLRRL